MRVFFCVAVRMMHPVHDRIRPRIQERRTLCDEREEVEEFFPERIHRKHLVRCITVKEKGLCKKRQEPMSEEKV